MNQPIFFTQFLMPDGREKQVSITRPEEIAEKAKRIVAKGLRFECEMLSDMRTVSLTITHPRRGDLDIEIAQNGADVPAAVDRLITRFAA